MRLSGTKFGQEQRQRQYFGAQEKHERPFCDMRLETATVYHPFVDIGAWCIDSFKVDGLA